MASPRPPSPEETQAKSEALAALREERRAQLAAKAEL